ncbi:MAG: mandelate racemase/muconate lactonizing enzyme family protein [Actinomycetota bacterium]|nr:mandelate racemase/muconate lactonizing enzyme family protein [Actinomycetota bacterium]
MNIARVETIPVKGELDQPFGNGQGWTTSRQYLIVRVVAEDGTAGYGECWGPIAGNDRVVEEVIAPLLVGENALATGRLWESVHFKLRWAYHSFAPYSALSGVDIALWDLKGKLLGLPVSEILGGAFRETVFAYATGHYFRKVETLEEQISAVLEEARGHLASGFKALKLKIGLGRTLGWGTEADIALVRALREEVGSGVPLMIDANCAYDPSEALRVGRAAGEVGVEWFGAPAARRPRRLCQALVQARRADRCRRELGASLRLPRGLPARGRLDSPARRVLGRRHHRGQAHRGSGARPQRPLHPARVGHTHRARCVAASFGRAPRPRPSGV